MSKYFNFSAIYGIIVRNLFEWRRNLDRIVDSIWWSTIDIIFWGLTSNYLIQTNPAISPFVTFFLGAIILWTFVQNSQRDINMSLLVEAWNRNLINLFTTPIKLSDFIAGTIILGMMKLIVTSLALVTIAYLLYGFNLFSLGWFLFLAAANLIVVGWWIGFFIDGLILRFGYRVEAFAWSLIFIIYPFSAVFYPVATLPGWARIIAAILPTSYVFEGMRSIFFHQSVPSENMIIAFFLNLVYLILSITFLKAMFTEARKNGRLVKLN